MTRELGDDPMHIMMRQIIALFDEYRSKENAKHTLRALKENARQGFCNGFLPPIGCRVVDAEKRGAKVKKKLERLGRVSATPGIRRRRSSRQTGRRRPERPFRDWR